MKRLWVLCHFALLACLGCRAQAQARPHFASPTKPSSPKLSPAVSANPADATDPLRKRGPAVFVTLPEIRARIRSSPQKLVLLHMWASWCPPCMQELPMMGELAQTLPSRGFEMLSVAMDEATRKNAGVVGRVIDLRAQGALTRAIARFEDVDAFVAGLDPQWEGSIPALLAYSPSGSLVGALYGEASRAEIDRFLVDLEPEMKRTPPRGAR